MGTQSSARDSDSSVVRMVKPSGMTPTTVRLSPSSAIGFADDVRIPCESPLPESVAQNDLGFDVAQVRSGGEGAADDGGSAKHGKEIRCDLVGKHFERFTMPRQDDAHILPPGHIVKGPALETPMMQICRGETRTRTWAES